MAAGPLTIWRRKALDGLADIWRDRYPLWRDAVLDLPMVLLFCGMVAGILACSVWPFSLSVCSFGILAGLLLAFAGTRANSSWPITAGIFLGTAAWGAWLQTVAEDRSQRDPTRWMADDTWRPVVFEARVDGMVRWRPELTQYEARGGTPGDAASWQTLLEVSLLEVRDDQQWRPAGGRLQVTVDAPLRWPLPGDRIRCFAKWQRIPAPTNPGQFDLRRHALRKGYWIRAKVESADQVEKRPGAWWWRLDRPMGWIMERADAAIHRHVPFGQAALASALVLGQRDQVEWEMQESLLATGTMHMLAISGLHVEMVAVAFVTLALLIHMPRKWTLLCTAILVVAYGILCGNQPPVLRAVLLVLAICLARWLGRPTRTLNLLAFAGCVVLYLRPSYLWDIGTQLSFLAVATLGLLSLHAHQETPPSDPLDQRIRQTMPAWEDHLRRFLAGLGNALVTSTWVWLVTAPLILQVFHVVSPVAIALNLLLWIPLWLALMSGLGILVLGTWLPWIGIVLGWICGVSLWVVQGTIDWAESLPGSHLWLPSPSIPWTLGFYIGLIGTTALMGFAKLPRRAILVGMSVWVLAGIAMLAAAPGNPDPRPAGTLRLTFIDVGHGTSVLLQAPDGQTLLYDAGKMGDGQRSFQGIASVLWWEGIRTIDTAMISHGDSDHYNALEGIAKRFRIEQLATTQQVLSHPSPAIRRWRRSLERQGVTFDAWAAGAQLQWGKATLTAMHPPPQGVPGSDNANSLCLRIEYAGRSILLPGDLESPGTQALIASSTPPIDLLMAPHHGSISQDPRPLIQWCQPRWIAISGSDRALAPKALAPYSDPNRSVWVTAREGAIRIEIDADGSIRADHWASNRWNRLAAEGPAS